MQDTAPPAVDQATIRDWLVRYISGVLDMPRENFPTADRFDTYGLDSVEAVIMAGVLEEEFRVPVDPMELFEHPSVDEFAAAFAERHGA